MSERKTLTTAQGIPVADNQNSITAGPRGPVMIDDFILIEPIDAKVRSLWGVSKQPGT